MKTITCRLPEKLTARLNAVARAERRSKSEVVREALEEHFAGKRRRPIIAYNLVKHLCGSIKGGPTDLATNPQRMEAFC